MLHQDDLLTRDKLDVDDYYRMTEAGILNPQDHVATVNVLNRALVLACGERAIVSVQNPLRLDRFDEPEPDLVVLRPRADFYRAGERAGPADALLVVEVADGSLRYDTRVKLPLYARMGVPEVWIVDVRARTLTAHRDPADGAYADARSFGLADAVTLAAAPDIAVRLTSLFG